MDLLNHLDNVWTNYKLYPFFHLCKQGMAFKFIKLRGSLNKSSSMAGLVLNNAQFFFFLTIVFHKQNALVLINAREASLGLNYPKAAMWFSLLIPRYKPTSKEDYVIWDYVSCQTPGIEPSSFSQQSYTGPWRNCKKKKKSSEVELKEEKKTDKKAGSNWYKAENHCGEVEWQRYTADFIFVLCT